MAKKKVIIGGTFNVLHKGHKALLRKAFELGEVTVGITSNSMAKKTRLVVKDFEDRKEKLENFIAKEFLSKPKIIKIQDKFGPALKEDFDFIVVSPDTSATAVLINKERRKIGKTSIKIIKIEFVLGKDKKPISSTKLLNSNKFC